MQTQSRLAVSGSGGSSSASEDEHEAVIRELTRGHELTAQLQAEALHALRGHGQAEATASFILQEVSRAFNVCLTIMGSPARTPTAPSSQPLATMEMPAPAPVLLATTPRRGRDDSILREQRMTSSPHHDGYQWRKYGQKRITKTQFPRCYFKCSHHRERNCKAIKQVQQCSNDDPPQFVVMYFNDHTCDTAAWDPTPTAAASSGTGMMPALDDHLLSGLVARQGHGARALLLDERGVQEEHERQLLVSSLAWVLGAQQQQQSPEAGSGTNVGHEQDHQEQPPPPRVRTRDDAPAPAPAPAPAGVDDAPAGGMPMPMSRIIDVDVDVDVAGLDVMDYDVTDDTLCFGGDSYVDLPGSGNGFPF